MGSKRMFSLDIVNDDKFLSMPASAQALYFHLGMRAGEYDFCIKSGRDCKKGKLQCG